MMIREIRKMSATATAGQPIGGTRRELLYLVRLPLFPGERARPNWKKGKPERGSPGAFIFQFVSVISRACGPDPPTAVRGMRHHHAHGSDRAALRLEDTCRLKSATGIAREHAKRCTRTTCQRTLRSWSFSWPAGARSSRPWSGWRPISAYGRLSSTRFSSVRAATSDFIVFATIGAMSFLTPPSVAARRNVTTVPPSRACTS